MKKIFALLAFALLLTGCNAGKQGAVTETDLLHRNYVLINFDGQAIEPQNMTPRIEFGDTFFVSGVMCNSFAGQGKLSGDVLTVTNMVRTQALCVDDVRNQLDNVIAQMLTGGARTTLSDNTLILKNDSHQLTFINRDWVR